MSYLRRSLNAYVTKWLNDKLQSLRDIGDQLIAYNGTKQNKLLMLRFSFAQKITYLLRTIAPRVIKGFAKQFNELKIDLFCKILDFDSEDCGPMQKEQILTHIRDGGFGLFDAVATADAAYMASVRACWRILADSCTDLVEDMDFAWFTPKFNSERGELFEEWMSKQSVQTLLHSDKWVASFIKSILRVGEQGEKKPSLFHFFTVNEGFKKLQKLLFEPIRSKHLLHMQDDWHTKFHKLRYADCVGNGEDSSAWLEAFPRKAALTLVDEDFRLACMFRLGVKIPEVKQAVHEKKGRYHHKCPACISKFFDQADIDDYGHHFAHGCRYRNGRTDTHNEMVNVLAAMHKNEGYSVNCEVWLQPLSLVTTEADGSIMVREETAQRGPLRADMTVRGTTLKVFEVTVADPCCNVSDLEPNNSTQPKGVKGVLIEENRETSKRSKYFQHQVILDGDIRRSLQVFAIGFFGRFNKTAYKYMRDLSFSKNRKGYEAVSFRTQWFQRFACALQRMHAAFFKENFSIFNGDVGIDSSTLVSSADYIDTSYIGITKSCTGLMFGERKSRRRV